MRRLRARHQTKRNRAQALWRPQVSGHSDSLQRRDVEKVSWACIRRAWGSNVRRSTDGRAGLVELDAGEEGRGLCHTQSAAGSAAQPRSKTCERGGNNPPGRATISWAPLLSKIFKVDPLVLSQMSRCHEKRQLHPGPRAGSRNPPSAESWEVPKRERRAKENALFVTRQA